ncbi:exosortase A [Thalassotalea euphylliae]|uniref:exosortase A n=1 Tax=Thalassotalea euphylliae TaxID=1655234 RepID=UPI00364519BA
MPIRSKSFFILFSIILVGWAIVFGQGLIAMESIWRRSDTFAHGYFILPICAWLLYRDRDYLLDAKVEFTWLPLPILAGSCFVWLFGYAADISVLSQLSSAVSLIAILWALMGNQLSWRYKFPLAYLLFAVPMGENLIPVLQDITAWITVFLLKLHGIPVFRDGLYIQTPTGLFEVAVACSGIRYLIASMAVGTLYAYLTYSSFKKQIIFTVFSFVLPIIANGIRAYLIVVIAHYSDMQYATGADHLVYGWIFFGFVIMLMFWVGGKFADPENAERRQVTIASNKLNLSSRPLLTVCALSFVFTLFIQYSMTAVKTPVQPEQVFADKPSVNESSWGVKFAQPIRFGHVWLDDTTEAFYVGYANKQTEGELISNLNAIYDQDSWTIVDRVTAENDNGKYRYLLLRNIQGVERAVLYWYQVGDKSFVNPSITKLYQAMSLLAGLDEQAQLVAVSTMVTEQENIRELLLTRAEQALSLATVE